MFDRMQVIAELTAFANLTVDVKPAIRTEWTKVMNHLHDRHSQRMQSVVKGRRNHRVDIVNEGHAGREILDSLSEFALGAMRIHGARNKSCFVPQRIALDFVVAPGEAQHLVAMTFEEIPFRDG